jgi:hypothetical protein
LLWHWAAVTAASRPPSPRGLRRRRLCADGWQAWQ